jgi:hypothetical protein
MLFCHLIWTRIVLFILTIINVLLSTYMLTGTKICARQNLFKTNTATGTNWFAFATAHEILQEVWWNLSTQRGQGMSNLVFSDAINTSPNLKPLSWKMIFKLMLKVFLMNTFLCNCTRDPTGSVMKFVPGRRQVPDHPWFPIRTLKET